MVPQNIIVKLEMFFLERKTLCESAVTDKTLRLGGTIWCGCTAGTPPINDSISMLLKNHTFQSQTNDNFHLFHILLHFTKIPRLVMGEWFSPWSWNIIKDLPLY